MPTRANNYYPKGKVIVVKRRIMLVLMAIAIAISGAVIAPASVSAEGAPPSPYSAKFIRDKDNCRAGTFIIRGVPGTKWVRFGAGWSPPDAPVYGGTEFNGKGGTNPNFWRKHFSANEFGGKVPTRKFKMSIVFDIGEAGPDKVLYLEVPACKK